MGKLFWEASETFGVPNDQGMRLTSFGKRSGGVWHPYLPDVVNAQLLGRDPNNPANVVVSGAQIVGAEFTFHDDVTQNNYYVRIDTWTRHFIQFRSLGP